jgi:cytochrome c556
MFRRFTFCLLAIAATTASAEDPKPERVIAYRQSVYRVIHWNFTPMSEMVRGTRPFDAAEFSRRARRVSWLTYQLEEGYAVGSDHGAVTDASPDIWKNWDDFSARLAGLRREAHKLRIVAGERDEEATKAQFTTLAAVCKDCHDRYKLD